MKLRSIFPSYGPETFREFNVGRLHTGRHFSNRLTISGRVPPVGSSPPLPAGLYKYSTFTDCGVELWSSTSFLNGGCVRGVRRFLAYCQQVGHNFYSFPFFLLHADRLVSRPLL